MLESTVRRASEALTKLGVTDFELIVIDDGSTDGTGALADRLTGVIPRLTVHHHAINQGYGAALRTGFAVASKDYVMYTDGDGQFDLADLSRFEPFIGSSEVMLGYRLHRKDHAGRKLNAGLWTLVVRLVLGLSVRDLDCAFKVIKRSALDQALPLESSGAVISAELLLKLKRAGYRFRQIGVHHYPRLAGQPTGAKMSVILRACQELVTLRRRV